MSKRNPALWFFIILLVYSVVAIIGFLIVYLIRNAISSPSTQQSITKNTSPSVSKPTITPPSGWKTYTDTKADFSVAYPSDLTEKSTSYGLGVSSVEMRSTDNTDSKSAPDYQLLIVPKLIAKTVGQDFDSYYEMADNTTKTISSPLAQDDTKQVFTKLRNRTIKEHRALDYRSIPENAKADTEAEVGTFIENGDKIILISTGESNKDELEQVISTLDLSK